MARNQTLQELLSDLRAECGLAASSAVGQSENPSLKVLLKRTREMLYDEYDWPHLDGVWFDQTLSAGQRYYSFPAGLNYERATKLYVKWGSIWQPVKYGFEPIHYNQQDSDNNQRADPVLRWRVYNGTQYEVWPLPATAVSVRFIGTTALGALEADSDVCELDGTMVVLFAAAERMADKPRGKVLAANASRRLAQVKSRSNNAGESFRPGSEHQEMLKPREITVRVKP